MIVRLIHVSSIASLCLWVILSGIAPMAAEARLDLWVLKPAEDFVTNNKALMVEGAVRYPEVQRVAVSVNTPSVISDLRAVEESLQSLTVDLGSSHSLTVLALSPVFEDGLSLGPRVVNLWSSEDGETYQDKGVFNCSSGVDRGYDGEARAEFGMEIQARFVRIDMLDGWQAHRIGVQEVGFMNAAGDLIKARVRGISVALDLDEDGEAVFHITILLKEGENQISIAARAMDFPENPDHEAEEKYELITVTYVPEVVVAEEPLTLSDGYKAKLVIPISALRPEVSRIGIRPLDVSEIEWTSYSGNTRIERGTYPVLAYEIEVSAATPFPATAKDSLERQPPGLAVDGNPEYPSTWMTTISALPVWLKVDFREPHPVGKVIITARVKDNVSYGPERLVILVSDDDVIYSEAAERDQCDDSRTEIELPGAPTARYVQILIEGGKQGNNIQINEVEFRDDEGGKIVSYVQLSATTLARPAELTLFYDDFDLTAAGVKREEDLTIFSWNEGMREWTMIGGKLDRVNDWIAVNLNHLSTFAIFEAASPVAEVRWSYNPFSPNGDGIADTTTISINFDEGTGGQSRVEIFDYTGKLVRTLMHEDTQTGHISIVWDGRDENGDMVSIGPYIYQVRIGNEIRNGVLVVAR